SAARTTACRRCQRSQCVVAQGRSPASSHASQQRQNSESTAWNGNHSMMAADRPAPVPAAPKMALQARPKRAARATRRACGHGESFPSGLPAGCCLVQVSPKNMSTCQLGCGPISRPAGACPQWVNMRRHGGAVARLVYLQQRTYLVTAGMAVECQKRKVAPPLISRYAGSAGRAAAGPCPDPAAELCIEANRLLGGFLQLRKDFVHVEAGRLLTLRIVPERHKELADVVLRRNNQERVIQKPIVVGIRRDIGALVRVGPQIEHLRKAQVGERLRPDSKRSRGSLLHEHKLPVIVP